MNYLFRKVAVLIFAGTVAGTAIASNAQKDGNAAKSTAQSVTNEIGKGFEAIGKVVGPPVEKAEKTIRGGAKDTNKSNERK